MVYIIQASGSHARAHWKDITESLWKLTHKYEYFAKLKPEYAKYGQKAVEIGRFIIANNQSGKFRYSQSEKRWNGWKNIERWMKTHNCSLFEAIRDCDYPDLQFDCSSLVLTLLYWGSDGKVFKGTWRTYTGGLRTVLRNSGCFDIYSATEYTRTPDHATNGALFWKPNAHVVMAALEPIPDPAPDPTPEPEPVPEEKTLEILKGTWYIRTQPNTKGDKLGVASKGDTFPYIGKTGWYSILYKGQPAFISNECQVKISEPEAPQPLPDTTETYVRVTGGTLKIRSGPSLTASRIGYTNETERYPVLDVTNNKWYEIRFSGGVGFISADTKYTELVNGQ